MDRKQRIVEYEVRHLDSRRLTVVTRGSKMNASKDSSIFHFVQRLRKAPEGSGYSNQEIVVYGEMPFFAEEVSKHHCRRAANRRVTRWVFRVRRRREERHP